MHKTNSMKIIAVISSISILLFTSCNKNKIECDGSTPTYNTEIKQIIEANCLSCHGAGSSNTDYSTYANLQTIINNGEFESEVITRQSMPRGSSLTSNQLSKIKCWIENGYPQ
jgi:hypothetical protein